MTSLFSGYSVVHVDNLVRNNIDPDNTHEDLTSLFQVLTPIIFLSTNVNSRSPIHPSLMGKFGQKNGVIDLLKVLGYERDSNGDVIYRDDSDSFVIEQRRVAAVELKKFYNQLKKLKEGDLTELQRFLSVPSPVVTQRQTNDRFNDRFENIRISPRRQPSDDDDDEHYYEATSRPSSRSSVEQPTTFSLRNAAQIREGNENNINTIRLLKESLITKHNFAPSHGFIRRRLAILLFKQVFPKFAVLDNDSIDEKILESIGELKYRDRTTNTCREDEIYTECLIRAHFNIDQAYEILMTNRPNLKRPVEPVVECRRPTETSLNESIAHLRQQSTALNGYRADEGTVQVLLLAEDEWKNAVHVLPAIIQLRRQYPNSADSELLASKIFRLIYSELNSATNFHSFIKIELLSYTLIEIPQDALPHVDMADIKDILLSCSDYDVDENFRTYILNSLARDCIICGGCYPRSRMESMFLCDHICCTDCVKTYYRGAIRNVRDKESLNVLTCYELHDMPEDNDARMNLFQHLDVKFNRWFRDEKLLLETYQENLFIATHPPNILKCSNPKCRGSFEPRGNRRRIAVECPHCKLRQCLQCSRKWYDAHATMECDAYETWLENNDADDPEVQLLIYLRTAGMMCPNEHCKAIFEYRAGGCEHFTCPQCRTEFCRICSAYFHNPIRGTNCQRPTCSLKTTIHAHCCYNCFREIRDAETDDILQLLNEHHIDVNDEFQQKPVAQDLICPVDGCTNAASAARENRFCETCYKQFLCLLIWRHQIEPWVLYSDNQLRTKLRNAGIQVSDQSDMTELTNLSKAHLSTFLGRPKEIPRIRR